MSRPKNNRLVHEPPLFVEFKPVGIKGLSLEKIALTLDEFEALRLADYIGHSHANAAEEMGISRPTFSRLIEKARKKLAEFIIKGKMLSINGGEIHFKNNIIRCYDCGHLFRTNINQSFTECPSCHSNNLLNLAGGFGHGKCCTYENLK